MTMGIAKIITGFVVDERRHSCSPRSRSPLPAAKAWSAAAKAWAQTRNVIHVRVFNGKTGELVKPSILMVRINHLGANHSDWIRKNYNGSVDVSLPWNASDVAIQATYDASTEVFINCDAAKQHNTSNLHWYKVKEIVKTGLIMQNDCKRSRHAEMPKLDKKSGEFVLFVRKRNWHEEN